MSEEAEEKTLSPTQRRAIHLMVACAQDKHEVAEQISVSVSTISKWLKDPTFAKRVEEAYQRVEKYDSEYRVKQNRLISDTLYAEIHRKIGLGKHEGLSLKELLKIVREMSNELRLDTEGDVTGKVKHEHSGLDDLQQRFKMASSKGHVVKRKKGHLGLIEMPEDDDVVEEDDVKEAANE